MSATLTVTSPYSGEILEELKTHDEQDIDAALASAHGLYRDRNCWLSLHRRVEILETLSGLMATNSEALALQAAREGGKPLADSTVEVGRAIDGIKLAIETIRGESGEVVPVSGSAGGAGRLAFTRHEPIGVVIAVSAFNHPLNLIVHQVVPAIAAGCPVIVKPSEDTPLSCRSLVGLVHEAGMPTAWCQMVLPATRELSEKLVTDSRAGFFSFIGSAKVGWMLRSRLAPGVRCALEHGGAAPLLIAADADLDQAVESVAKGGFYHAGQVCVSVQRVFVHEAVAGEFTDRLADRAKQLRVGDPADVDTEVGPLIRPAEVERVDEWVNEALREGGELRSGGQALANNCYAPTVIWNPPTDCRLSKQEVFGPVVCIYPYAQLEDALEEANSLPFAFQAAIFTRDIDTALKVHQHIDASAVMVNDHTAFRVDGMPFAGLRQSGLGIGGIPHTIHDMQIAKMMVIRSPEL